MKCLSSQKTLLPSPRETPRLVPPLPMRAFHLPGLYVPCSWRRSSWYPPQGVLVRTTWSWCLENTQRWPHGIYAINADAYLFPIFKNCQRMPTDVLAVELLPDRGTLSPCRQLEEMDWLLPPQPHLSYTSVSCWSLVIGGPHGLFIRSHSRCLVLSIPLSWTMVFSLGTWWWAVRARGSAARLRGGR